MIRPQHPRIAVIGPGAVGTVIAGALHEQGRTPFLAGRSSQPELVLENGRRRIVIPGPVHIDPRNVQVTADVIFLAVKTTQTSSAARWLAALCRPGTVVCVLQNGVEQREEVLPLVPEGEVVPAIVWFPAVRQTDDTVKLLGEPHLTVPDMPGSESIRRALQGTFGAVEISGDFTTLAWRKLLQNAAAGLMALTGRRSGMFSRDDIGSLTLAYLTEGVAIARAEGARFDDEEPQRLLDKFRSLPADMGTSILTDREQRRPLEWDSRNGVLQRRGRTLGIPTPISDILVPLLAAASDGPG